MNPYNDWMMTLYTNRMMNSKNGRAFPDERSLLARRRPVLALEQGDARRRNEKRPPLALEQGSTRRRNERRLALALGQTAGTAT